MTDVANLEPVTLAWVAGFIDGEGSIGLHREYDKRRDRWTYRPAIQISNTSRDAMDLLEALFPAATKASTVDKRQSHYKTQYHFAIRRSAVVLELLKRLLPYLVVKRQQADMLIAYLSQRQSSARGRRHPYTESDAFWFEQLRNANKRGVTA